MTRRPGPSELVVVNLWTGPCGGKSTVAAGLFNLLKQGGVRVELVSEFAKDLTYERNYGSLENQLAILGEQDRRLRRLVGQVDFAITDSPLPMGMVYMTPEYEEWLPAAIEGAYERYTNVDFLLARGDWPYQTVGRNQTQHEALTLDMQIRRVFTEFTQWNGAAEDFDAQAFHIRSDEFAPFKIAQYLEIDSMEKLLAA
ncbi:AAA family ATPase [Methylobacterium ajmalii]|jgi:hypothetical protein|uniref:AAA family ATPase n=1 Tax=Methylobacterium ajmalii TaxID=2738439 RepID=UPI00190DC369|nr:AAA family ATPase [Methylobacterium ajmalii]MBK3400435.1 AAA family ATPase [Methylobacterium ajmalii]MBK3407523.1 AAA family ATPase [Methylobacterium ajmalii]MBK3422129.1 AAA family ATPase [Methylobacterium ajmalii]MBZ6416646.1 ATP-binding protein [Methylobacterium sp.]